MPEEVLICKFCHEIVHFVINIVRYAIKIVLAVLSIMYQGTNATLIVWLFFFNTSYVHIIWLQLQQYRSMIVDDQ
jgi:hypothetical protein